MASLQVNFGWNFVSLKFVVPRVIALGPRVAFERCVHTANCIIIDHFSAFEPGLVAHFLTLPLKNGWQWVKTARNLNIGVSRNRFCDFLADPDSRSFSRFGRLLCKSRYSDVAATLWPPSPPSTPLLLLLVPCSQFILPVSERYLPMI
jgi:hypothetical protein